MRLPGRRVGLSAADDVGDELHRATDLSGLDGTGGHVFAENYEQHQKNVARLRAIEKEAAPPSTPPGRPEKRTSAQ